MQLAEFATADCLGLVLAHRQNFTDGSIAKGTLLTAVHLAEFGAAGIDTLICACPAATFSTKDNACFSCACPVSNASSFAIDCLSNTDNS